MSQFDGFPKATVRFLEDLAANNDRNWFQANKNCYESDWLQPALDFVAAMESPLRSISPLLVASAKRSGGSIMRIYRDTRFSKDKAPYKTNIGIQFRHRMGKDVHAPGLYVHIEPGSMFLGAGVWHPDSATLKKIRQHLDAEPGVWKRASRGKAFSSEFELAGESLTRPPQGFSVDHAWIEDLRRKDFIGIKTLAAGAIHKKDFLTSTVASFRKAKPLMQFLCDGIGLPF